MRSLEYRRKYAQYFFDYACQGEQGVSESHPVYKWVTENRDGPTPLLRAKYSSCADLAHAFLFRVGIDPACPWLNREEETDKPGDWKSGVNLNWLVPKPIGKCDIAKHKIDLPWLAAGDIVVVNNKYGGHVMCVTDVTPGLMHTAEYGQPGGMLKKHGLTQAFLDTVISHISLADTPLIRDPDTSWLDKWLTEKEREELECL